MVKYKVVVLAFIACVIIASQAVDSDNKQESNVVKFGKKLLDQFMINPNFTMVNHASYGATPISVYNAKIKYIEEMEWNIDDWMRNKVESLLRNVRQIIADYIGAESSEEIVFIENASDGYNSVIKSFNLQEGDKILRSTISYPMVKFTEQYLQDKFGIKIIEVTFTKDTLQSKDSIISEYKKMLDSFPNQIKVATIDHISSFPSILFPVKELVQLFHSYGVPVIVDGAHAVGNVPLDMADMDPDFYFSNFHKWAFAPKNSAFLYVNQKYISMTHPNIIGNFYGQGFEREFFWTGTRDFSSYLAVEDALNFRNAFGDQQIMQYNRDLAYQAALLIKQIYQTDLFVDDKDLLANIVQVRVPCTDYNLVTSIVQQMLTNNQTYFVVFQFDDIVYARFSAQIYNDITDYTKINQFFVKQLQNEKCFNP